MKNFFLPIFFVGALFMGCTANTYDDITGPIENTDPEEVTFQDVNFVFQNVCQACHSNPTQNGAPMPLVTFDNVVDAVQNRGLIDRISRNEGAPGLMPLGGPRLPQATIDLIVQWNEDGLLEE
ncbi:MAG: cytochrome c [Flavobacteriaceae bacterium]|nr:cytochrome c [Flavobacteriaceae bacterium]